MNRKMNRRTKIGVGIAAGAVVLAAAGMGAPRPVAMRPR
jgi:hypothetical protein